MSGTAIIAVEIIILAVKRKSELRELLSVHEIRRSFTDIEQQIQFTGQARNEVDAVSGNGQPIPRANIPGAS